MADFNKMQSVKRRFFAMRNGVVADTMRRGGSRFRIIFGLNLPQIVEIARETGHDPALARELWRNTTTRESMLLAPMLMSPDDLPRSEFEEFVSAIDDVEVADVVCHRLLRRLDYALEAAESLAESSRPIERYLALRLMYNILDGNESKAKAMAEAEAERGEPLTRRLAMMLAAEAAERLDDGE